MAGVLLKVDDRELKLLLPSLEQKLQSGIFKILGQVFLSSIEEIFEDEGPPGAPWPERKDKKKEGKILTDTAALRDSITAEEQRDSLVIGSDLVYAAIHQFGGEIRPKTAKALIFPFQGETVFAKVVRIPARPYLVITDEALEEANDAVEDFLTADA